LNTGKKRKNRERYRHPSNEIWAVSLCVDLLADLDAGHCVRRIGIGAGKLSDLFVDGRSADDDLDPVPQTCLSDFVDDVLHFRIGQIEEGA